MCEFTSWFSQSAKILRLFNYWGMEFFRRIEENNKFSMCVREIYLQSSGVQHARHVKHGFSFIDLPFWTRTDSWSFAHEQVSQIHKRSIDYSGCVHLMFDGSAVSKSSLCNLSLPIHLCVSTGSASATWGFSYSHFRMWSLSFQFRNVFENL